MLAQEFCVLDKNRFRAHVIIARPRHRLAVLVESGKQQFTQGARIRNLCDAIKTLLVLHAIGFHGGHGGIFCFALAVLFYVVTLPVEFNASGRAVKVLAASYLPEDEVRGVKAVLSAAALTYVAAALQAVLQLLRLILISGNSRRRD